jgi:pSer/pThr/pTyr-binding forkhead associated (FHA) protein
MNGAILLLIFRIVSASLLLVFLGVIAWLVYQDLQRATSRLVGGGRTEGHLRVLASDSITAGAGTVFPLLPVTRIGRAEYNTIVLEDAFVSAEHALLALRENQWWLEDLDSRNGTLLNDLVLAEPAVVSAGDVITIGSVKLKIEPTGVSG